MIVHFEEKFWSRWQGHGSGGTAHAVDGLNQVPRVVTLEGTPTVQTAIKYAA